MARSRITRRTVLKQAALASASILAAPYVRTSYAAGKLTLGCWDHWVPGANDTLTRLCNEWGTEARLVWAGCSSSASRSTIWSAFAISRSKPCEARRAPPR